MRVFIYHEQTPGLEKVIMGYRIIKILAATRHYIQLCLLIHNYRNSIVNNIKTKDAVTFDDSLLM
jgi:hypothetical protein